MKKSLGCLVFGLSLFLTVQPVFAQTNLEYKLLQKEIESIKEGQDGIRKDIQELKKLVQGIKQAPAAPGGEFKEAVIDIKGAPIKGDKKAKLVLLEFADYQ
mgnify:CR=1 FL=1|jgi:prefoldin subunit 5